MKGASELKHEGAIGADRQRERHADRDNWRDTGAKADRGQREERAEEEERREKKRRRGQRRGRGRERSVVTGALLSTAHTWHTWQGQVMK